MTTHLRFALVTVLGLGAASAAWAQQVDPNAPAQPQGQETMPAAQPQGQETMPSAPPPIEEKPVAQAAPPQQETPTMEKFQQTLSPHGRWVNTPEYGQVWVPNNVGRRWRPYTKGRWVYTDHGWTFVSRDPWGWAPHHYGRWVYYPGQGWSWIPGYEWSPAWVSWRYGPSYMAWAPLGPVGVSVAYYNTPSLWFGVPGYRFYAPLYPNYFIPTVRMGVVFGATYYAGVPRVGVYFSPPVGYISRWVVRAPVVRFSARAVAPYWVSRGVFRPSFAAALRRAPVIAAPYGYRGRIGAPLTRSYRTSFSRTTTTYRPGPGGFRSTTRTTTRTTYRNPGNYRAPARTTTTTTRRYTGPGGRTTTRTTTRTWRRR
jgi:hypothetical protein